MKVEKVIKDVLGRLEKLHWGENITGYYGMIAN